MDLYQLVNQDYEKIVAETDPISQVKYLSSKMSERGMDMEIKGEKHPFPTFLKPYFVDMKHRSLISKHTRNIIRGVEKVGKLFLEGNDFGDLVYQDGLISEFPRLIGSIPAIRSWFGSTASTIRKAVI